MKTLFWSKGLLFGMALVLIAGCQSTPNANRLSMGPITPRDNEVIVRDQLIIIVDETGSIGSASLYKFEKSLVQAFTDAMPDGVYESGLDSFAGVKSSLWLKRPLETYDRSRMNRAADNLEPLGSLTPLARAIRSQEGELARTSGRAALLIFSDGKVRIPEDVYQACRDMAAVHHGELCIFTVHVGNSDYGRDVMRQMASVNGCGKYYSGEAINSPEGINALVRDVFFGAREVRVATPAPHSISWTINNVHFANDSSVIESQYFAMLDEAANFLKHNAGTRIRIRLEGHTDHNASHAYNQGLSERRVNAVHKALVDRGASPSQIETAAFGETRPAVPNTSPQNLRMNRRVELSVIQ